MPGGFCRTSDHPDVRAISMNENAQTADVWVISDKPVDRMSLLASKEDVRVRRILGHLPSRAADNLFWLGRYLERAEATLRLVRCLCTTLLESSPDAQSAHPLLLAQGAADRLGRARRGQRRRRPLEAARKTLHDGQASGSVIHLVQAARGTAAKTRERLSGDFWVLLLRLETALSESARHVPSEVETLGAGERRVAGAGLPVRPGAGEHEPRRRLAFPGHGSAHRTGNQHLPFRAELRRTMRPWTTWTWCSISPTARSPTVRDT